jgi:hypothetical protein
LIGLVLLRKVLRHALHAFHERQRRAGADGALHPQQAFAAIVVDARKIRGKSGSAEFAAQSLKRGASHEC